MVAFDMRIVFKNEDGSVLNKTVTVTDIVGEFCRFEDGNSFFSLPSKGSYVDESGNVIERYWYIVDCVYFGEQTVIKNLQFFVNNKNSGEGIMPKFNISTSAVRQFFENPLYFHAGTLIGLKQE